MTGRRVRPAVEYVVPFGALVAAYAVAGVPGGPIPPVVVPGAYFHHAA